MSFFPLSIEFSRFGNTSFWFSICEFECVDNDTSLFRISYYRGWDFDFLFLKFISKKIREFKEKR